MGAKAPSKLNLRRPTYKCDSCPKKFLSAQALKSHQYCVHKIKGNSRPVRGKAKLDNMMDKTIGKQNATTALTVKETKAPVVVVQKFIPATPVNDLSDAPISEHRKIEFECPQCLKLFTVFLTAYKHIQRFHCMNDKGQKVAATSPDLIKPIRVELCSQCNRRLRPNEPHRCSESITDSNVMPSACQCTACEQQFANIQLFDVHVSGLHCEGIESLFFPSMSDFQSWMKEVESKTGNKYFNLTKCVTKHTFHCSFFFGTDKGNAADVSRICPSSIVVREYSKGIQVHFYQKHYGHSSPEYTTSNKFSQYVITSLMDKKPKTQLEVIEMFDNTDLYVQFKTLMDNIVLDAAKLKINHLKVLIGKALEMSTVLKQYNEEDFDESQKPAPPQKTMSDAQITYALESFTKDLKRKKDVSPKEQTINVKRVPFAAPKQQESSISEKEPTINTKKTSFTSTKKQESEIINKNATMNIKRVPLTAAKKQDSPILDKESTINKKRVSFTATKKQDSPLIDVTKSEIDIPIEIPFTTTNYLNENKGCKTPMILNTFSLADEKDEENCIKIKSKVDKQNNFHKVDSMLKVNPMGISPSSISTFNDSYREFVDKNFVSKQDRKNEVNTTQQINSTEKIKVLNKNDINERIENKTSVEIKTNNNLPRKTKNLETSNNLVGNKIPGYKKVNKTSNIKSRTRVIKNKVKNSKKAIPIKKAKVDNKKKIMKTKIGQYKPSLSPKKPEEIKESRISLNTSKSKADFEYEVKERENDCNILILKI